MTVKRRAKTDTPVVDPAPEPEPAEDSPKPRGRKKKRRSPCGFCSEVNKKARHDLCPVIIRNADQSAADKVWHCPCALEFPELHHRVKEGSK